MATKTIPMNIFSRFRSLFGANALFSSEDRKGLQDVDPRIVIGRIEEITEHPDPKVTKVQVTQTRIGDEVVQVLCGGTNIAEGMIVPVATVGTDFGDGFVISKRDIRGATSMGMICSREELGLSPGGKGEIWALGEDFAAHIGKPINAL